MSARASARADRQAALAEAAGRLNVAADGAQEVPFTEAAPAEATEPAAEPVIVPPWRTVLGPDEPIQVTRPGVYQLDAAEYHADPVPGGSISSSGARKILTAPALFDYYRRHGSIPTSAMELGSAAHKYALTAGAAVEVVPGERWDTNVAKAQVAEARAAGRTPLKQKDFDIVQEMAEALRAHPMVGLMFDTANGGRPEQALFWRDPRTRVVCRCLLDWLPPSPAPGARMVLPEYKSTKSANPADDLEKSIYNFGYHHQAEWNARGVQALGLADEVAVLFIFQEKSAPYLVTPVELTRTALAIAALENARALETYQRCTRTGIWPGYTDDIEHLGLPPWVERRYPDVI